MELGVSRRMVRFEPLDAEPAPAETGETTSGGVLVTDELVEELAAEAEAGYDVERLRPRPVVA